MLVTYPPDPTQIFTFNRQLKLIPEFKKLTGREMSAVVLIADVFSPLRRLYYKHEDATKLRRQVCRAVGFTDDKTKTGLNTLGNKIILSEYPKIEDAIDVYKEMQGGESLDTLYLIKENLNKQFNTWKQNKDVTTKEFLDRMKMAKQLIIDGKMFSAIEKEITDLIQAIPDELQFDMEGHVEEDPQDDEKLTIPSKSEYDADEFE